MTLFTTTKMLFHAECVAGELGKTELEEELLALREAHPEFEGEEAFVEAEVRPELKEFVEVVMATRRAFLCPCSF